MTDDWEFSEDDCPKCQKQLTQRQCMSCGGDGYTEDEDDDFGGEEHCDNCDGEGWEIWCRSCGWDVNFNCFLNKKSEQAYKEGLTKLSEG